MWAPLRVHSHYSCLSGLSKPNSIAERCAKLGYGSCALTDLGTLAGSVSFVKSLKDVCQCGHQKGIHAEQKKRCSKKGCPCEAYAPYKIKPILGCEFYLADYYGSTVTVICRNKAGWLSLIQASNEANRPENIVAGRPYISLERLASYANNNWFIFTGQATSTIFGDTTSKALTTTVYEDVKLLVQNNWKRDVTNLVGKYRELFGAENVFIDLAPPSPLPAYEISNKILRHLAPKIGAKCVATGNSFYSEKKDAADHRLILCTQYKATLKTLEDKISSKDYQFLKANGYHIASLEELNLSFSQDEITNANEIASACETYDILGRPILPNFECPNGLTPDKYFRELCVRGWKNKIQDFIPKEKIQEYSERIKRELSVLCSAGLSSYFLIVQDYCNWARAQGFLIGPGRGSSAGCLAAYLLGITSVDPIPPGLIFERFYNAGRNTVDRVAFPDIDSDFPKDKRDDILRYIEAKYGPDRVCQMLTFNTFKGRASLSEVFRAHDALPFDQIKKLSKQIPQEAGISDQLQFMREATGEASAIRWSLENMADAFKEYCYINSEGELEGEFAHLFAQAIRIEGTKKSPSKHASGIIISKDALALVCPMVYDKNSKKLIAGLEMNDLEAVGFNKFDILGVNALTKVKGCQNLYNTGDI